jgi:uncharacterized protein YbaA (DUF1428 family)
MPYVDGFVVPVSKDKIEAYKALARKAAKSGNNMVRSPSWNASATMCRTAR